MFFRLRFGAEFDARSIEKIEGCRSVLCLHLEADELLVRFLLGILLIVKQGGLGNWFTFEIYFVHDVFS